MAQAENKTQQTTASVQDFINKVTDERQKAESQILIDLMTEISGEKPKMWGPSIIGFGKYHYKYESGREGDMPKIGFSPRKGKLALYIACNTQAYKDLITKLGKYKTSVACLYIKRLEDVDVDVLKKMIVESYKSTN